MNEIRIQELQRRLKEIEAEKIKILNEISNLSQPITQSPKTEIECNRLLGRPVRAKPVESTEEKIALFMELFRCRESVYPKRWESAKTGKHEYSPVCTNEWKPGICHKPKVKCAECNHRAFAPLNHRAVEAHLKGMETIGTYAIREDDTCTFLACDFDKEGWREDVAAYRLISTELGIDVGIEKSRSGNGAHAWIFFEDPVPAKDARMLGTIILSKCQEQRHELGFDSFDRFFPNQDVLPNGGFGNLIALPLQKKPREHGNSVFLDINFNPFPDQEQWQYMSSMRRLSFLELKTLLSANMKLIPQNSKISIDGIEQDQSLSIDQGIIEISPVEKSEEKKTIVGQTIEIVLSSQLQIPIQNLPSRLITKLKRTASFANPEFYKQQRMRMLSFPNPPRFIFSGELRPEALLLPRGCLDKVKEVLTSAGGEVIIRDERLGRKRLKVEFNGQLNEDQEKALAVLKRHDTGVLSAPPGAGKTVLGCALIAQRNVTTLVLVHRQPLLEQWTEQLQKFLGLEKKDIGVLGGSKKRPNGKLDLAMLQTLTRMETFDEIAENYAQIIIDEAHHIPAASFEGVMKSLPARYVVGLTATPYRKDGLEKILFQQCGPIRHTIESTDGGKLLKRVIIRETGFRLPDECGLKPAYHELLYHLTSNCKRNEMMIDDTISALEVA